MARGRRDPSRARWLLPAALTLTAAVATAGVYFWREMEDHEASTGFRSEDEETADERRKTRGMAGRSFGNSAPTTTGAAGITGRVSEIWKEFFQGSSDESDGGRKSRAGPSMSGPPRPSSSGASSSSFGRSSLSRSVLADPEVSVPVLGNSQEIDWEKKRIIALVISGNEELDESLLLSLPTPVDISRWILLIFVKSRSSNNYNHGYSSMSELDAPTPSASSTFAKRLSGSFRRGRRSGTDDSSDLSEETSVDNSVTLPGLILKTFGRDFPHQQVMHYSTPMGVVHMLRSLGVSIVFLSESCASVDNNNNNATSSSDEAASVIPGSLPVSPPPGTTASVGGGEIVVELKNWVGEIVLVLDEEEDDSAPVLPSAVSGGEDDYGERRRRMKGKDKHSGTVGEATGRKRRWLKDKNVARGITICDRQGLKGIWRAKVEGARP
ncbi:uncharacterized protein DFL_001717 [Arthrobotrys flagrans]|uniref:Uncharacterized protein n=1 Tax=Arthrobotrys flagrans TaxID=97331 RepID=A0A437A8E0_ARTFL|nr:hypothetical protein DFL_001717 [Arthrobotrys flagrans]